MRRMEQELREIQELKQSYRSLQEKIAAEEQEFKILERTSNDLNNKLAKLGKMFLKKRGNL